METGPGETLVTMPVPDPTVATNVALLLQLPPVEISVNPEVDPMQILVEPDILAGSGLTVIVSPLAQPVAATL